MTLNTYLYRRAFRASMLLRHVQTKSYIVCWYYCDYCKQSNI